MTNSKDPISQDILSEKITELMLNYSAEMYKYRNIMNPTTKWENLTAHQRSVVSTYRDEINHLFATHTKAPDGMGRETPATPQTDEHGNPIIWLNAYEAEAVCHLIKNSDPQRFNTGDWFSDVPFKIEKFLAGVVGHSPPKPDTKALVEQLEGEKK